MESSPAGIGAFKRAVEKFKTQLAFAKAIGVPQSRVSELLTGAAKSIPAEWCPKIEEATEGDVTRSELRPDLWPREGAVQRNPEGSEASA